ncbi:Cbp3p-Cbp6 complex protein [Malassezia pachydermatis]
MSSAVQEVRKSLLKLAQTWPKDPLRPTMDFGEAIRRATESELSGPQAKKHVAEARKSLAALERIRSSESLREYPTPRTILQPASAPTHYTQLVEAMSRIARGQSVAPSWTQRLRHFFGLRV